MFYNPKKLILFISVMLLFFNNSKSEEQGKHLFILSGQSNMRRLDPDISFTPTIEKEFGLENVIVVKDAQGGQPIRRWYKKWKSIDGKVVENSGDLYDRLMTKVNKEILDKNIKSVTFIWMQGEKDAKEKHGEVYGTSLIGLYNQLMNDMNCKKMNFIIGRLSDFDMENKKYPHWTMVRKIQVEVANSNSLIEWIDTDDLNGVEDKLHYTKPEGYFLLGERFSKKSIELIELNNN